MDDETAGEQKHRLVTGSLLTVFGAATMVFVIFGGSLINAWNKEIIKAPPTAFAPVGLFLGPALFVLSLLSLFSGLMMLVIRNYSGSQKNEGKKSEQTEPKKVIEDSSSTVSYAKTSENYLKKHQLYIGMALAILGMSYQIFNAANWGWWVPQGKIDYNWLTPQQRFAFDFGFLAVPLFIVSFVLLIIGVALWFYSKD